MSERHDDEGESFGSELRRRQSPTLAREQRRKSLYAGLVGLLIGLVVLFDAIDAMRTGRMVHFGARNSSLIIPGWLEALAACFVLFLAGSVLWRNVIRAR